MHRRPNPRLPLFRHLAIIVFGLFPIYSAAQQTLTPEAYQTLSQAVFEVVIPKLDVLDSLKYAEPLPLELLPYSERNDPYLSIGTAFCIGDNRFLSAAHVFALDEDSLNSEFFIRNTSGSVYKVAQVYKYANHQDCIMFSVQNAPQVIPLIPVDKVELNTRVFTVGNAYGQGIIIRDGMLTSTTPEERDGAWKWLRFSAAASPGNSGGPLVDSSGRVLGIAIARSENENFNLALPLSVVDSFPDNVARLNDKRDYGLPIFNYTTWSIEDTTIRLPLSVPELRVKLIDEHVALDRKLLARLLTEQADKTFPRAKGSGYLLRNPQNSIIPGIACEQSDYNWKMSYPDDTTKVILEDQNNFEWGTWCAVDILHYSVPEGIPQDELYDKPEMAMDSILTGYNLTRTVAGKNIRITSLGIPSSNEQITDRYGRIWLVSTWSIAFADQALIWFRLPTPDGFVGFLDITSWGNLVGYIDDQKEVLNYTDVDYSGSLEQWSAFLERKALLPSALRECRFDYRTDKSLLVATPELSLNLPVDQFSLTPQTDLYCYFTWARDPSGVFVQNINSLYLLSKGTLSGGIGITRVVHPAQDDTTERQSVWELLATHSFPLDGTPYTSDGMTYAFSSLDLTPYLRELVNPGDFPALYTIFLNIDSQQQEEEVQELFNTFYSSINVFPRGVSTATGFPDSRLDHLKLLHAIDGLTIFDAIERADMDTVQRFLTQKLDLNAVDRLGRTPLIAALYGGDPDISSALITAGVDIQANIPDGWTPLMFALLYDHKEAANLMIAKGVDIQATTSEGWTALMFALTSRNEEAAKALINKGANIQVITSDGWTPLMLALQSEDKELAALLLDKNANIQGVNSDGWTALLYALASGNKEAAKMLINNGANIQLITSDGFTPLMLALRYQDKEAAKLLLEKNANLQGVTSEGWTALMFALRYDSSDAAIMMLQRGADVKPVNSDKWTALMYALRYGQERVAKLILAKDPDIQAANSDGWTPLMFALRYEYNDVIKILVERGADLNRGNQYGETGLHFAIRYSTSISMIKFLLERGADPEAKATNGQTPINLAELNNNKEALSLLKEYAAKKR